MIWIYVFNIFHKQKTIWIWIRNIFLWTKNTFASFFMNQETLWTWIHIIFLVHKKWCECEFLIGKKWSFFWCHAPCSPTPSPYKVGLGFTSKSALETMGCKFSRPAKKNIAKKVTFGIPKSYANFKQKMPILKIELSIFKKNRYKKGPDWDLCLKKLVQF